MGRWKELVVVAALAFTALPAVGQPPTPGMPPVPGDAAQLYEDVQLLRTIRTLDLSNEQLALLLQINASLAEQRRELAELRASTWAESKGAIESVLEAWVEGKTPSSRDKSAADRAVNRVNEATSDYERARQRLTEGFYEKLSTAQRKLVESSDKAADRAARVARMGGVESVGDYVLTELDAIRDMMPDEFRMLAGAEARRIATAIVGPNAANLEQMTAGVLNVLQQAYAWAPERYREQRPTMPQQIEQLLGIEEAEQAPVPWNELMRLTTSTRTTAVITALVPPGGGEVE